MTSLLTFGQTLRAVREAAGLTQTAVAAQLGVSTVYVSDVERDRRAPFHGERLRELTTLLGVPDDRLFVAALRTSGRLILEVTTPEQAEIAAALATAWPLPAEQLEALAELLGR